MATRFCCLAITGLLSLAGLAWAAGNGPSPEPRDFRMAEVAAVEDANVLVLQAGGQTSRVRLAGVRRAGSEIEPEAPGRQEEQELLVCQLGDTGCAQNLGSGDPRQPADQRDWNQRARAFLEGLLKGRRVRVVFIESDAAAEPRLALLYRASDGLFVNSALVRQGYALAADQPVFKNLKEVRQAQSQAQAERAGLWGAPPEKSAP